MPHPTLDPAPVEPAGPRAAAHPLDNPAWAALSGPHAALARTLPHPDGHPPRAAHYPSDIAHFAALADPEDPESWAELARLRGPDAEVVLAGRFTPPPHWTPLMEIPGVQLVAEHVDERPDPEAVELGPEDVPEILDLIARTRPGPFLPRTVTLGGYLGLRAHGPTGPLIAMAGRRLHLPGHTEISAVCTDPDHRGRGLAGRLVRAVAAGIRAEGRTPFLHTGAANAPAIRLYENLGFTLRHRPNFLGLRTPAA
ncbi:GNAT family N-acetyltransferase [Streptomyces sp. BI20]|uniref:GNAT family N-acetyltransferase n=1 Tax=Streptomyces sp. BI20 TaxID=3403460 RepID=UPI003C71179D